MKRHRSLLTPLVAVILGLGVMLAGFGSAAVDEPYLKCRWQEEVDLFSPFSFPSLEEAITATLGVDVALPADFASTVTVLTSTEEGSVVGVANAAVAEVATTVDGEYFIPRYTFCSPVVPPDAE